MSLRRLPIVFSALISVGILLAAHAPCASAQDVGSAPASNTKLIDITQPVGSQSGRFGVGMGSMFPAYGLSGTYRFSELITGEAILGLGGNVQGFAGRVWYRFKQDPTYDVYGFATAGLYRHDYYRHDILRRVDDTESVIGLGAGAGLELSWAKILDKPDFPPIYSNVDLGFVLANFDYYDWSGIVFGGGIHYRFGN